MMTTNPSNLYGEAQDIMRAIDQEVNRPEEDAVPFFICHSSRKAIQNYLTGFLNEKGVEPQEPASPENLLKQCQTVDTRFGSVDMSPIACRAEASIEHHCEDLEQVCQCYEVAKQVEQIVRG